MVRPFPPWMLDQRVLPIRRQIFRQFPSLLFRETGADADVLQVSGIVKKPKQQRSYGRALAILVPSKPGHDAIAIPLMLDLEHDALVRLVDARKGLRYNAVQTRA